MTDGSGNPDSEDDDADDDREHPESIPDRLSKHDFPGIAPTRSGSSRSRRSDDERSVPELPEHVQRTIEEFERAPSPTTAEPEPDPAPEPEPIEPEPAAPADSIDDLFPYPSYREHQREILVEAYEALFENDYETVVIDAPTGIGKSGINVALAQAAKTTFLTTPQKKLRRQLEEDPDLSGHYEVLRARADYSCYDIFTCADCPVNESPDMKCSAIPDLDANNSSVPLYDEHGEQIGAIEYPRGAAEMDACPYWSQKVRAMQAQTAVLTPAYLYVDNNLPPAVSFVNRELLIIDECHALAEQAASLWAGFSLSPATLPDYVYDQISDRFESWMWSFETFAPILEVAEQEARAYIDTNQDIILEAERAPGALSDREDRIRKNVAKCHTFLENMKTVHEERANGREWVVEIEEYRGSSKVLKAKLVPIEVDTLLADNIWSRANKYVLSTATLPYRGSPDTWLSSLGLDPDRATVISKPMPFPARNRLINTGHMIGKFSGQRDFAVYWDDIVQKVVELAERHADESGLIHTVSYDRARRLADDLPDDLPVLVHEKDEKSDEYYLNQWLDPDTPERILLSPALTEGVDLADDACRWQILLKIPFDRSSRTEFKLSDPLPDWTWYYDRVAREIIQAVGRGVRHDTDYCTFYILDESFVDVRRSVTLPDWFTDAITADPAVDHQYIRSIF